MAEAIEAAADLIERDGWFRLSWAGLQPINNRTGKANCAVTALCRITGGGGRITPLYTACVRYLVEFVGGEYLTDWNDSQLNGETVVATMREAAERIRANPP